MKIRLASSLQPDSIVDGEGVRTVIWTQGCPHACPGCHNPGTHDFDGGALFDPSAVVHVFWRNLVSRIRGEGIGECVLVLYSRIGYAVVEEAVGRVACHGRRDVVAVGLEQLHRGGNAILECGIARSRMAGRAACMEQDAEYPGQPYPVCPKFCVFLPLVHKRQKYVNPSIYSMP